MSTVIPFQFDTSTEIRTLLINDDVWFVASDIAKALSYEEANKLTRMLDDDEQGRHIVETPSGDQEMNIINESGLYHALVKSRKPEAKPFRKWVTGVVLPSIRKTGKYEHASMAEPTISRAQYFQLTEAVNKALRGWCFDNGDREKVINNIRLTFNLKSLKDLPASQFNLAMALAEKTAKMANECLIAMNDFKEDMMREVVMGGAPHTSSITRKYKAKFGTMPKQINWVEMAKALEVV